jgi:hypothetical protein
MRLFFDLRLGYLVEAPGQSTPSSGYIGKAGDGQPVELQFGRSPDPLGSSILFEAPTWTSTGLPGGTVIQLAIKASGEFSDGPVLASTSTFSYDAGTKTYSGALNLNTEQINTELERGNDDDEDDIASVLCGLEVTYQSGGSGAWASSVLPVQYQINHDLIYGDEATPTNAEDPDEYLLKAAGIEYFPTVTSKIGGTSADLDAVPTVLIDAGKMIAFSDLDGAEPVLRVYKLTAGTEAEASPVVIRPDDYNASTNAKYWLAQDFTAGLTAVVEDSSPILGGDLDAGGFNVGFDADTGITDDSGNETLYFGKTASAVNYLSIKNAATGSGAAIESKGSDTNIDLILTPKGSGKVKTGGVELMSNPMTTAGDLITGGASGAPGRLGVGSNGQVLTVTAGAPAWGAASSAKSPFPTSEATWTSDFTITDYADERLFILDITSGNVTALIGEFPAVAGTHYWLQAYSATPMGTGYLNRDSNVVLNGPSGDANITLTLGRVYHIYLVSAKVWRLLDTTA